MVTHSLAHCLASLLCPLPYSMSQNILEANIKNRVQAPSEPVCVHKYTLGSRAFRPAFPLKQAMNVEPASPLHSSQLALTFL